MVVKLGTKMITRGPYTLDTEAFARLAMDIADLRRENYEIIVVTSAAIAAGMGRMGIHRRPVSIPSEDSGGRPPVAYTVCKVAWQGEIPAPDDVVSDCACPAAFRVTRGQAAH